jgi:replicative DNA helicase
MSVGVYSVFDMKFAQERGYDSQNRSGEADLIIAKHRNGPTRTITVAAQLHFARFTDMAQNQGSGTDFTQQRQSEE